MTLLQGRMIVMGESGRRRNLYLLIINNNGNMDFLLLTYKLCEYLLTLYACPDDQCHSLPQIRVAFS